VWEHTGEGGRRLHCWEANLADVVALSEAKDAPDLVHGHAALNVNDGAVEGPANVLKVAEDEGLVHVKPTGNDVLAVLSMQNSSGSSSNLSCRASCHVHSTPCRHAILATGHLLPSKHDSLHFQACWPTRPVPPPHKELQQAFKGPHIVPEHSLPGPSLTTSGGNAWPRKCMCRDYTRPLERHHHHTQVQGQVVFCSCLCLLCRSC